MKIPSLLLCSILLSSCGAEVDDSTVEQNFEKSDKIPQQEAPKKETNLKDRQAPDSEEVTGPEEDTSFINVTVSGLRNLTGQICYAISKRVEKFPPAKDEALESECVDIEGDKTTFQIDNLEMNELHAISVFHDENFNGNLDMRKILGIAVPGEGFGFSGNPGIKMLGYKFDDCAFRTESDLTVNIAMKYINL